MSKYLELAKKLNELVKRGIGGEQVNASRQLDKLLKKHNIRIEDLEEDNEDFCYFKIPHLYKFLFECVANSVILDCSFYKQKHRHEVIIKTTLVKKLEIEAKYNFYLSLYKKEYKQFQTAFLIANKIFALTSEKDEQESEPMNPKELIEILSKASKIEGYEYHKQLQ